MKYIIKKKKRRDVWHRWFAWHPVCVEVTDADDKVWVWLRVVERIIYYSWDGEYREVGSGVSYHWNHDSPECG